MQPQNGQATRAVRAGGASQHSGAAVPRTLVSFDIDGTLEIGEPAGPIPVELIRAAQTAGCIVGSASDRPLSFQRALWADLAITMDFVGGKHHLDAVAERWQRHRLVHIGDTHVDRHYASLAGFEFLDVAELPAAGALGWLF